MSTSTGKHKLDTTSSPNPAKKTKKTTDEKPRPVLRPTWTHTQPDGSQGRLIRRDLVPDNLYSKAHRRRPKKKKYTKSKETKKVKHKSESEEKDVPFYSYTKRFDGHIVVITGGGRGIGQACALRFAHEGASVVILDKRRWKDTLKKIRDECKDATCEGFQVDITDGAKVSKMFEDIRKNFERIDVVVQCVGIEGSSIGKRGHEIECSDLEKVLHVNVCGTFTVAKTVIPYMVEQDYGRIVNVVSVSGKEGNSGELALGASSAAVISATKSLGKDYAHTGITVNAVATTTMTEEAAETKDIPMGRTGEYSEISGLIAFIASEENSYTTGHCYDISGGHSVY